MAIAHEYGSGEARRSASSAHPLRWIVGVQPTRVWLYTVLAVSVTICLAAYHLLTVVSEVARIILPTFSEIGEDLGQIVIGMQSQAAAESSYVITEPVNFGQHVWASFVRWGIGMVIGTAIGFPGAIWLALSPVGSWFTERIFPLLYAIPSVLMTFLVLAVVGHSLTGQITVVAIGVTLTQIVIVFYGCLVVLYGSRMTDASKTVLIDRAVLAGVSRWQLFWHILVPWSMPNFFLALRLGSVFALGDLILAESISTAGVGHLAHDAYSNGDKPRLFAMTLVFMAITCSVWYLLDRVQRYVLRWQQ